MEVFSNTRQFLAKPFPQEESFLGSVRIIALICVFVVLFLYIFKPFGIHTMESKQLLICVGFGVVSFLASVLYELIIVFVLKIKGAAANFTFGKWIIYLVGVMFFISLANFLFVRIVVFGYIEWALFPYMVRGTLAIGIFPIVTMGALALLRQEKKYQTIAEEINQKDASSSSRNLDATSKGEHIFDIPLDQVRYVEAMQNYIKIGYLDTQGQLQEKMERATLKSLLAEPLNQSILRCHRSFLVNRGSIVSTSGNAQGLLLSLAGCDKQVPVSRSYISSFR